MIVTTLMFIFGKGLIIKIIITTWFNTLIAKLYILHAVHCFSMVYARNTKILWKGSTYTGSKK